MVHVSQNRKNHKVVRALAGLCLIFLALLTAVLVWVHFSLYPPSTAARRASSSANVTQTSEYIKFDSPDEKANVVFINGALVNSTAYGVMAQKLTRQHIDVYLVKSPLNLPVLNAKAASRIISEQHLTHVYLAGHSLGGVIAAGNVDKTTEGLILLASYPSNNTDLSRSDVRVLSLTATSDTVLQWDKWHEAKKRLPYSTTYTSIRGGNHAGFGSYGVQKGDGKASISNENQQSIVANDIADFILRR